MEQGQYIRNCYSLPLSRALSPVHAFENLARLSGGAGEWAARPLLSLIFLVFQTKKVDFSLFPLTLPSSRHTSRRPSKPTSPCQRAVAYAP